MHRGRESFAVRHRTLFCRDGSTERKIEQLTVVWIKDHCLTAEKPTPLECAGKVKVYASSSKMRFSGLYNRIVSPRLLERSIPRIRVQALWYHGASLVRDESHVPRQPKNGVLNVRTVDSTSL